MSSEKCDRCGSIGSDRRTLWMDCFYAMEELGIPFTQQLVLFAPADASFNLAKEPEKLNIPNGPSIVIGNAEVTCDKPLRAKKHYTLRVCKRCRAEWMGAIKQWFRSIPQNNDDDADSPVPSENPTGIYVRQNGMNVQVTEEEYRRMRQEKANG